jgi:hypothetical protein
VRKRDALSLCIVIALVAGCKRSGSQRLEGRWHGRKADGVPETSQAAADAFANGTDLIAHGNQIAIYTPAGRPTQAVYKVDKEDPTTLVIHTELDNTTETFALDATSDTLTWKIDPAHSITFKRVR